MKEQGYSFDGVTILHVQNLRRRLECIYDNGGSELMYATKKTYQHREEGLNFDYKYVIHGMNFREFSGDEDEYPEKACVGFELLLVVMPESLNADTKKKIEDSCGACELFDMVDYGLTIQMLSNDGIHTDTPLLPYSKLNATTVNKVANFIDAVDRLRGFFLDKSWNRIGTTGWDTIFECVEGKDSIKASINRAMEGTEE
jgi:hypothetical protein